VERCVASSISNIDVGVSIQQKLDTWMMGHFRCIVEWCVASMISSIHVGTTVDQDLDASTIAGQ